MPVEYQWKQSARGTQPGRSHGKSLEDDGDANAVTYTWAARGKRRSKLAHTVNGNTSPGDADESAADGQRMQWNLLTSGGSWGAVSSAASVDLGQPESRATTPPRERHAAGEATSQPRGKKPEQGAAAVPAEASGAAFATCAAATGPPGPTPPTRTRNASSGLGAAAAGAASPGLGERAGGSGAGAPAAGARTNPGQGLDREELLGALWGSAWAADGGGPDVSGPPQDAGAEAAASASPATSGGHAGVGASRGPQYHDVRVSTDVPWIEVRDVLRPLWEMGYH